MEVLERFGKIKKRDIYTAELTLQIIAAILLFYDKMFTCEWWDFLDNTHLGARMTAERSLSFFGVTEVGAVFRYSEAVDVLIFICAVLTAVNIILLTVSLHNKKAAEVLNKKGFAAISILIFSVFAAVIPTANIHGQDYYAVREAYRELSANTAFYAELLLLAAMIFLSFVKRLNIKFK